MASALDRLIQAYKPVLENTHHAQPHAQLYFQQLGTAFMNVIMLPLLSGETLSTRSSQQLQFYAQNLLEMVSQKKQVSIQCMANIIGRYISDWFIQSHLVKEVQGIFQNFLVNQETNISPSPSPQSNLIQKSYKQALYQSEQIHVKKVLNYLTELETPYNELKLISQHMEWKQNVEEPVPEGNEFLAIAEINIDFKDCKKTLRGAFLHKQKKFAKSVAVFKVLRDIYIGYPQVWNIMETIKLKNNIKLPKDPINLLKSIPIQLLNQKIQPKYPSYRKDEQFFQSKEEYLSKISSFKAERNLLTQQCPNTFNFIFQKIRLPDDRWKVQGQMKVNFQGKEKTFKWQNHDTSAKMAEEVVVKRLIEIVYVEYVDIFYKMASVKKKKNIST